MRAGSQWHAGQGIDVDSNQVPLWAFLLTALAAVIGPFVSTIFTNRHARQVLAAEQIEANRRAAEEEQRANNESKRAMYTEAIRVFSKPRTGNGNIFAPLTPKERTELTAILEDELHQMNARLAIGAPANVALMAEILTLHASNVYSRYKIFAMGGERIEDDEQGRYHREYLAFIDAIRKDMGQQSLRRAEKQPVRESE